MNKIATTLALAALPLAALAQEERPPGLKDPGQQPSNRPTQVPT